MFKNLLKKYLTFNRSLQFFFNFLNFKVVQHRTVNLYNLFTLLLLLRIKSNDEI